eukprot:646372-Amphidinium_carterae.1
MVLVVGSAFSEGRIPASMGRLAVLNASMMLGFGLIGPLPPLPSTMYAISAFGNQLEGHLPELKLEPRSAIILHSNRFSCHLPWHERVQPAFALVLLGNSFTVPRG